jgi:hypothetical protein
MARWFARWFEQAEIAFAPIPGEPDEYQILVWVEHLEDEDFKKVKRTRLSFYNFFEQEIISFRPERGYMLFAYVLSLLKRQRFEAPGWWRGQPGHGLQELWRASRRGLAPRKATLLAMAMRIGNMGRTESLEFLGVRPGGPEGARLEAGPRDVLTSDCAQLAMWAAERTSRYEPEDEWCHICERGGF